MSYLEKKYGRNIVVTKEIIPEKQQKITTMKQNNKIITLKLKTLYLLLIIFLILGIVIGSIVSNTFIKFEQGQCENTLKGGDYNG